MAANDSTDNCALQPPATAVSSFLERDFYSAPLTDRTFSISHDTPTTNTGDPGGANDQHRPLSAAKRRRIKERIKQFMLIEELFEEDYSYPSYYVIKFPGVYIDSELNVIATDNEIRQKVGILKQMQNMDKSSILVQINNKFQIEKIPSLKMIDRKETIVKLADS